MNLDDTIVAVATPPGRGGIGVVRLAGPDSRAIATGLLRTARHRPFAAADFQAGQARIAELVDPGHAADTSASLDAERMDEVVVTFFAQPHSYTTDDIVEISAHGSPVVLRHIVELAVSRGARLAEPGEFTMRAFLNGRLDLTQAEAVRDLIDSQTLYQAKVAAQQLEGALSHRLTPIKNKLVELIAVLEAGIDFADDDIPVAPAAQIRDAIAAVCAPLEELAASFAYGKLVHEGLTLAIVGRPNVGKSSLFNRLVERERAIVTALPGTTRDLVTETVSLGGIPVRLVDTAGIRMGQEQHENEAETEAERLGIRKSMEALADADLVLLVLDAAAAQPGSRQPEERQQDERLLAQVAQRPAIVVENKIDLVAGRGSTSPMETATVAGTAATRSKSADDPDSPSLAGGPHLPSFGQCGEPTSMASVVRTSALTGEGIAELRAEILKQIGGGRGAQAESGFLTNVRHQGLVRDSLQALEAAVDAVNQNVPHEMLLLDLYAALRPLDDITGATTTDDILNLIFSSFCIGK